MEFFYSTTYFAIVAAILGLVMGSFLTCAAGRQMAGEQWVSGHSVCDACGHELGVRDLVPVVSWLVSGGKCRYCKAALPASYPLSEILCAIGYATIVAFYGLSLETLELLVAFSLLYAVAVCDWVAYTIPNGLVVALIAVRVVFGVVLAVLGMPDGWLEGLICGVVMAGGVLVLSLVFEKLRGVNAMGGGDIKLLFAVGLYLSVAQCLLMLVVACIVGIVLGLVPRATAEREETTRGQLIPFGTAIAVGFWVTITVGVPLISWYMGVL